MALGLRLIGWAVVALQAAAGNLAQRHYLSVPALGRESVKGRGTVSIVIPARNERKRLPVLLHSLSQLEYLEYEILVVDDGSTDGTDKIAEDAGVRVLRVDIPEPGWNGKSFACWTGAGATTGRWLLFTDADTEHGPRSLGRALALAEERQAGLLSLLTQQRCRTFWERLLLPYVYALYFVGARNINQRRGAPVANGQYMLFRRDVYDRIGGHQAIRGSVIDDVALARLAAGRGEEVILARGEEDISVRMYESFRSLWEGFSKNAIRFVSVSPRTGLPTVVAGLAWSAGPLLVRRQMSRSCRAALLLTPMACMLPWERRFGVPGRYVLLQPLAALVFQSLAMDSIRRTLTHSATWKGRRY